MRPLIVGTTSSAGKASARRDYCGRGIQSLMIQHNITE